MNGILQAEFERVQSYGTGNLFHVTFDWPIPLRYAITAKGSSGGCVGVDNIGVETDIRRLPVGTIAHV